MTPCRNQVRHDPELGKFGDCHRCCVAAILDLEPGDVPHFTQIELDTGRPWLETLREWLAGYGFGYFRFGYTADNSLETILAVTAENCPGVPLILGGSSAVSPDVGHSVVIMDGKIVMDPSGSGIGGPIDGVWCLEQLTVGPNWGGRRRMIPAAELEELAA